MSDKQRYDFRMYLKMLEGSEEHDVLAFRAFVIDEETYYYLDVPGFGVDKTYKDLFLDIITGRFALDYYNIDDIGNPDAELHQYRLESQTIIDRIEEAKVFVYNSFGLELGYREIEMETMVAFRFDGHDLNLAYGLSPKSAGEIFAFSNEFVTTMSPANNKKFGEILQVEPKAASTTVPYIREKIDDDAIEIVKKVIGDINAKSIDRAFANQTDNEYAVMYKKLIKQFKDIRKFKDLKTFEVIFGEQRYAIDDFEKLNKIESQLYNEQVAGTGTVHHLEKFLITKPNIFVAVVISNGNEIRLHLDINRANFEQMIRILKENEETGQISFSGYKTSEKVIFVEHISPVK